MDKKKEKEEFKPYFKGLTPEMDNPEVYWKGEQAELPKDFKFWIMSEEAMERSRQEVERFRNSPEGKRWMAESGKGTGQ